MLVWCVGPKIQIAVCACNSNQSHIYMAVSHHGSPAVSGNFPCRRAQSACILSKVCAHCLGSHMHGHKWCVASFGQKQLIGAMVGTTEGCTASIQAVVDSIRCIECGFGDREDELLLCDLAPCQKACHIACDVRLKSLGQVRVPEHWCCKGCQEKIADQGGEHKLLDFAPGPCSGPMATQASQVGATAKPAGGAASSRARKRKGPAKAASHSSEPTHMGQFGGRPFKLGDVVEARDVRSAEDAEWFKGRITQVVVSGGGVGDVGGDQWVVHVQGCGKNKRGGQKAMHASLSLWRKPPLKGPGGQFCMVLATHL